MPGPAWILVKPQWSRADHSAIGHPLGGRKIPLQARILQKLHVAEVGEPLTADFIGDEILIRAKVDARQILDRVGVLSGGEAADCDTARIAGVFERVRLQLSPDPGHGLSPFGVAGLFHFGRRHLLGLERCRHLLPALKLLPDCRAGS